jgi:hypothetical protein
MQLIASGPVRTPELPSVPGTIFTTDGQVHEYLVSCPMHTLDARDWQPIRLLLDNRQILVQRPIGVATPYKPEKRTGSEGAEAFCTILRLQTTPGGKMSPQEGWAIVERVLDWIRIKCRHYWIFHGFTGYGALYRGATFTKESSSLSVLNFAAYAPGVVVRPLTEPIWLSIREELESGTEIPVSESIFCDALLSLAARDEVKAVLEAGVAVEVALTQLLREVSSTGPNSPAKAKFKAKGERIRFREKLLDWPQFLALQRAADFKSPEMQDDWVDKVQELYQFRNAAAHSGTLRTKSTTNPMALIIAANGLLEYCRAQRLDIGLSTYSMPANTTPLQQLISCNNATLFATAGPLNCTLAR